MPPRPHVPAGMPGWGCTGGLERNPGLGRTGSFRLEIPREAASWTDPKQESGRIPSQQLIMLRQRRAMIRIHLPFLPSKGIKTRLLRHTELGVVGMIQAIRYPWRKW